MERSLLRGALAPRCSQQPRRLRRIGAAGMDGCPALFVGSPAAMSPLLSSPFGTRIHTIREQSDLVQITGGQYERGFVARTRRRTVGGRSLSFLERQTAVPGACQPTVRT